MELINRDGDGANHSKSTSPCLSQVEQLLKDSLMLRMSESTSGDQLRNEWNSAVFHTEENRKFMEYASKLVVTTIEEPQCIHEIMCSLLYEPMVCEGSISFSIELWKSMRFAREFDLLSELCQPMMQQILYLMISLARTLDENNHNSSCCEKLMSLFQLVILGYQQGPSLVKKNLNEILRFARHLKEQSLSCSKASMVHLNTEFQLVLYCLLNLHRGHMNLVQSIQQDFSTCTAIPSSAAIQNKLRECCWIQPLLRKDRLFPWFEGLWTVDDFQELQPQQSIQTGNSIRLGIRNSALSRKIKGKIVDQFTKKIMTWEGYLYQQPDRPHPEIMGQWKHLHEEAEIAGNENQAAQLPEVNTMAAAVADWICSKCTMMNRGGNKKCEACNSDAPATVVEAVSRAKKGTNPAPVRVRFDPSQTFLHAIWSRGDNYGIWLGRKICTSTGFDLKQVLREKLAETPQHEKYSWIYSPEGNFSKTIVLSKPMSLHANSPASIAAWIFPRNSLSTSSMHQTILSNGQYRLYFTPASASLSFYMQDSNAELTFNSIPFDTWTSVVVTYDGSTLFLYINGKLVRETQNVHVSTTGDTKTPLVFGGRPTYSSSASGDNVLDMNDIFVGSICEVQMYSASISEKMIKEKFNAKTNYFNHGTNLIGSWPLMGKQFYRYLADETRHGNHGMLYSDWLSLECVTDTTPNVGGSSSTFLSEKNQPLINLPCPSLITHRSSVEYDKFLFFGSSQCRSEVFGGSDIEIYVKNEYIRPGGIWYADPVSILAGFESQVVLSPVKCDMDFSLVFSQNSFWRMESHIDTIYSESLGYGIEKEHSILFVQLSRVGIQECQNNAYLYSCSIRVHKKGRFFCLGSCHGVHNVSNDVAVVYDASSCTLSVIIGEVTIFTISIDIARILVNETVTTSAIATNKRKMDHSIYMGIVSANDSIQHTMLSNWIYKGPQSASRIIGSLSLAAVHQVYNLYSDGKDTLSTTDPAKCCSKYETDGSAIKQEMYGTCNLLHDEVICIVCAAVCHEGHELVAMGEITGSCACSNRGLNFCKTKDGISPDLLHLPVKFDTWCCSKCTVKNSIKSKKCTVCGAACEVELGATLSPAPASPVPMDVGGSTPPPSQLLGWTCKICTVINESNAKICATCGASGPSDEKSSGVAMVTEWSCDACTMINPEANTICYICSTKKPTSSSAAEASSSSRALALVPAAIPVASSPVNGGSVVDLTGSTSTESSLPSDKNNTDLGQPFDSATLSLFKAERDMKKQELILCHADLNLDISENWELTIGPLELKLIDSEDNAPPQVIELVEGEYIDQVGKVRGIAEWIDGVAPYWTLKGEYRHTSQRYWNAFDLKFNPATDNFQGFWYRGDGSGDWKCNYTHDSSDLRGMMPDSSLYTGLVNMKSNLTNICYQNSFLQALAMTDDFQLAIMSDSATAPTSDDISFGLQSPFPILSSIQVLFAKLTMSQRPSIASHQLQKSLPEVFLSGRQQDTSDFANYLMEQLDMALATTSYPAALRDAFGGEQVNRLICTQCHQVSKKSEYFWEYLLNMVDLRYTPIIDIKVVSGTNNLKIPLPEGYSRINIDLNTSRNGNPPCLFLCVKRASSTDEKSHCPTMLPITDLTIQSAPHGHMKPTVAGFERLEYNLNLGGSIPGNQVYLFYQRDPKGAPITDLQIVKKDEKIPQGYRQINTDLNQSQGTCIYLTYQCDMPVRDLQILSEGRVGYKTENDPFHFEDSQGSSPSSLLSQSQQQPQGPQYLAYTNGGNLACITDIVACERNGDDKDQVLAEKYTSNGYQVIEPAIVYSLKQHLPSSSPREVSEKQQRSPASQSSRRKSLMIRRGEGNPIYSLQVFRAPNQIPKYQDYEIVNIWNTLEPKPEPNVENALKSILGTWKCSNVDESQKKIIQWTLLKQENVLQVLKVMGKFSKVNQQGQGGIIEGIAQEQRKDKLWKFYGTWKDDSVELPQYCEFEFGYGNPSPSISAQAGMLECLFLAGKCGQTQLQQRPTHVSIQGKQVSHDTMSISFITDIILIQSSDPVPSGYDKIDTTLLKKGSGDIGSGFHICVYRQVGASSSESSYPIIEIGLFYSEIDILPADAFPVQVTHAGAPATLKGVGSEIPMFLWYKRSTLSCQELSTSSSPSSYVQEIGVLLSGNEEIPKGYSKLQQTALGMSTVLHHPQFSSGAYLCFKKVPVKTFSTLIHPINGKYHTDYFGQIHFQVTEAVSGVEISGHFRKVMKGSIDGQMDGVVTWKVKPGKKEISSSEKDSESSAPLANVSEVSSLANYDFTIYSKWIPSTYSSSLTGTSTSNASLIYACQFNYCLSIPPPGAVVDHWQLELDGWWSQGNQGNPKWHLIKDNYFYIGYKKDYGTLYEHGKLKSTDRITQPTVSSMIQRNQNIRTLGGDNALHCDKCQTKTKWTTQTLIETAPKHLIFTLKRISYNYEKGQSMKNLQDIEFEPTLEIQVPLSSDEHQDEKQTLVYGLYGVLVHSGVSANSGHYYSYLRQNAYAIQDLQKENSAHAPWIKFNDQKVLHSSWMELTETVKASISDCVYILFYKQLPSLSSMSRSPMSDERPDDHTEEVKEEEEAMLLAQAMALSMSSTKLKEEDYTFVEIGTSTPNRKLEILRDLTEEIEQDNVSFWKNVIGKRSCGKEFRQELRRFTLAEMKHSMPEVKTTPCQFSTLSGCKLQD